MRLISSGSTVAVGLSLALTVGVSAPLGAAWLMRGPSPEAVARAREATSAGTTQLVVVASTTPTPTLDLVGPAPFSPLTQGARVVPAGITIPPPLQTRAPSSSNRSTDTVAATPLSPTPTLFVIDAWQTTLSQVDAAWDRDFPRVIEVLNTFLAR